MPAWPTALRCFGLALAERAVRELEYSACDARQRRVQQGEASAEACTELRFPSDERTEYQIGRLGWRQGGEIAKCLGWCEHGSSHERHVHGREVDRVAPGLHRSDAREPVEGGLAGHVRREEWAPDLNADARDVDDMA